MIYNFVCVLSAYRRKSMDADDKISHKDDVYCEKNRPQDLTLGNTEIDCRQWTAWGLSMSILCLRSVRYPVNHSSISLPTANYILSRINIYHCPQCRSGCEFQKKEQNYMLLSIIIVTCYSQGYALCQCVSKKGRPQY